MRSRDSSFGDRIWGLGYHRNITKTQARGLLWVVGRNHLVGFQVWDAWLSESESVLPQIWWYDAVSKRRYSMGNSRPRPNTAILAIGPQQIKWTHNVAMSTAREKYEDTLSSRYARVAYSADKHDIFICESILRTCTSQPGFDSRLMQFYVWR